MKDEDKEECSSCEKLCGDDEYEDTRDNGILCLDCLREEHPTQVTIGQTYSDPKDNDIEVSVHPDIGTGAHGVAVIAIHTPTGIAAWCGKHPTMMGNKKAALALLRKIHSDVERLESNERYGNIME